MLELPQIDAPGDYVGLYVFDFGPWRAVGYTAEEVAMLLESEQHRGGAVYRIHSVRPDGRMELRSVSADRFSLESGMMFCSADADAAKADFDALVALADAAAPPCRAAVHLVERTTENTNARFACMLIFPAEHEDDISHWLLDAGYAGGQTVEGGISAVTDYYEERPTVLERQQLWPAKTRQSRSREEVYGSVRRAVQR